MGVGINLMWGGDWSLEGRERGVRGFGFKERWEFVDLWEEFLRGWV